MEYVFNNYFLCESLLVSCTYFTFLCGPSQKPCTITDTCWEKLRFTVENFSVSWDFLEPANWDTLAAME